MLQKYNKQVLKNNWLTLDSLKEFCIIIVLYFNQIEKTKQKINLNM